MIPMRIADGSQSLPKRAALTLKILDAVKCPAGKSRVWVYDVKQPGLAFLCTSSGAKGFYVVRKLHGRKLRFSIGKFPAISIETARKLARKEITKIADGVNPLVERRAARAQGMNLGELWKWFLETWAKPRKRSWRDDEIRYGVHLKAWEKRRLTEITRSDVAALHTWVSESASPTTANRVLSLLSTMFNRAREIGWERPNPCAGIVKFTETSRERFLSAGELKSFFAALESEPDPNWKDLFSLCLYTGARRGNLLSLRWEELNLPAGLWSIPASKFKNGKAAVVHLPTPAAEILTARQGNGSEWVFPSHSTCGHLVKPESAWKGLCVRAGLADLRIHDLRRTLGSWQAAGGSSLAVIGKSLGHRSMAATAVYARLELDPVKQSVNAAVSAMQAAGKAEAK